MVLDQLESDKIKAKNLLLNNNCTNCYYYHNSFISEYQGGSTRPSCHSFLRAKRIYKIYSSSEEFYQFKLKGLPLPEENICEYWES